MSETENKTISALVMALPNDAAEGELCKRGKPAVRALSQRLEFYHSKESVGRDQIAHFTAIAKVLGNIGDPQAVPALILALDRSRWNDVLYATLKALGKIGDKRAVPKMCEVLCNENRSGIHLEIIFALPKMKGGRKLIMPALIAKFKMLDDDNMFWGSRKAMIEIGPRALPYLAELVSSSNDLLAVQALSALSEFGKPALQFIISSLEDGTLKLKIRGCAVDMLKEMGYPEAIPALVPRLLHDDFSINRKVLDAVMKLGGGQNAIDFLLEAMYAKPAQREKLQAHVKEITAELERWETDGKREAPKIDMGGFGISQDGDAEDGKEAGCSGKAKYHGKRSGISPGDAAWIRR